MKQKSIEKARQRMQDIQVVENLRAYRAKTNKLRAEYRRVRRAYLNKLTGKEKKDFLSQEKLEQMQNSQRAIARAAKEKRAYLALSPAEKKAYRLRAARMRRLERRADNSLMVVQIFKCVLIAALIGIVFYAGEIAYSTYDNAAAFADTEKVVERPTQTPAPSPSPDATQTPEPTLSPYDMLLSQADLEFMKNRVNILVLGIDESIERSHWGTFRTDTMILLSVNFETKEVDMISLPRDSYVWIYGDDVRDKINSAFASGGGYNKRGFEYTMNTVSMVLGGVPVNHYVCFDMNVVKEVVNALGGLYYDVDIDVSMGGRKIKKGYQYMDGQMVLDYCRQRKGDSDISRTDRQQRMILAIFDEVKRTGQIQNIPAIYTAVTGNIYTDLTLKQIASLSFFALDIDLANIERHTLPGGFLNIDGTSFWGINQSQTQKLVKQIFGANINVSETDDVAYLQALAQEKRNAVASAGALIAQTEHYMAGDPNYNAYVNANEHNQLVALIQALRTVAAVKNTEDVSITIPPINDGMAALQDYFNNVTAQIQARKAAAAVPEPPADPAV